MISFIIATVGRPTLERTLKSVKTNWLTDEILLVGDESLREHLWSLVRELDIHNARFIPCPPGHDWGSSERNFAMPKARGRYLAFIDDDDVYVPDFRELMQDAIEKTPDVPIIFRMRFPNGITLWYEGEKVIRCGNVGTPTFIVPNVPERLGTWGPEVGGDCIFLETCNWPRESVSWRPEIIALLGHNT